MELTITSEGNVLTRLSCVVDVINIFLGNLDFPKFKKLKKSVWISEPALKCENKLLFSSKTIL